MRAKNILLILMVVIFWPHTGFAESVSNRLSAPNSGKIEWHASTGVFFPNEGDLDPGLLVGFGLNYNYEKESVFIDILYSSTNPNIDIPGIDLDSENIILNIGLMKQLNENNEVRIGAGIQIHQMDLENLSRNTRVTIFGMGEYDISDRYTLQLQNSYTVKKYNIRFGGFITMVLYKL